MWFTENQPPIHSQVYNSWLVYRIIRERCFHGNLQTIVAIVLQRLHMHCSYQLVVVGRDDIWVSIGNQEQLAIGVDGEETQEVILPLPYEVGDGLGFGLGRGFAPRVNVWAAVERYSNHCKNVGLSSILSQPIDVKSPSHIGILTAPVGVEVSVEVGAVTLAALRPWRSGLPPQSSLKINIKQLRKLVPTAH